MSFKLGSSVGLKASKGNIETKFSFNRDDASIPGNPIERVPLDGLGLADKNGTIYINEEIMPGSEIERQTIMEEMKHMTDLKTGKLDYDDNYIYYRGESFERVGGEINYNGKMYPEGDSKLPWEAEAKIFD